MKWRHQWEVDTGLKEWTPPEVLLLYHPSGTSGHDKDGAPGKCILLSVIGVYLTCYIINHDVVSSLNQ